MQRFFRSTTNLYDNVIKDAVAIWTSQGENIMPYQQKNKYNANIHTTYKTAEKRISYKSIRLRLFKKPRDIQ